MRDQKPEFRIHPEFHGQFLHFVRESGFCFLPRMARMNADECRIGWFLSRRHEPKLTGEWFWDLVVFCREADYVDGMKITRAAAANSTKRGNPEWFTGTVWLDEIAGAKPTTNVRALRVSFEPGARTAWHTHPFGQWLHILSGVGRVQRAGGGVEVVVAGDTVWFEAGERHWHGAAPDRAMVHLAIQQTDAQGNSATWAEHVSDTDYNATPSPDTLGL